MIGRWIAIDPGETVGWSVWEGDQFVSAGQTPMWEFLDRLKDDIEELTLVVCEDWRLYPWEVENLAWDECRTARAIGAIEFMCRHSGTKLVFQAAKIKEGARQAGAENFFLAPLHPNRHANDSIMHAVYYLAMQGVRV